MPPMRFPFSRYAKTAVAAAIGAAVILPTAGSARAADPNAGVEEAVRAAFAEAPEMIAVAKCESRYRQFASEGVPLRGGSGKGYIGVFQIGERLHAAPAKAAGYDIYAIDGNIGYARKMYEKSGSVPWRECVPAAAPASGAVTGAPASDLAFGAAGAQVRALQRLLNAKGFVIATSGPGSPGSETSTFGTLTREALKRFQCAKGIVCEGSETTTGYGRFGPKTRAALLAP